MESGRRSGGPGRPRRSPPSPPDAPRRVAGPAAARRPPVSRRRTRAAGALAAYVARRREARTRPHGPSPPRSGAWPRPRWPRPRRPPSSRASPPARASRSTAASRLPPVFTTVPTKEQDRLPDDRRRCGEGPRAAPDDERAEDPVQRLPQRLPGRATTTATSSRCRTGRHPATTTPSTTATCPACRTPSRSTRSAASRTSIEKQFGKRPAALPPAVRQLQPGHPARRPVLRHQGRPPVGRRGVPRPHGVARVGPGPAPRRHHPHPLPWPARTGRAPCPT